VAANDKIGFRKTGEPQDLLELGFKTLIGYLLGSLVGALVVGRFRGVDIRELGSGNAGGTNALRTQGFGFAAATVVIDIGKGWLAAAWLPQFALPGVAADPVIARDWLASCCAAGAVAGHVWPLYYGFRGGKGGATLAGTLLALAPVLLAIAVAAWLAAVMLFGFVGLATTLASVVVPIATLFMPHVPGALFAYAVAMAILVAFAHRGNFSRIRAGTEPRVQRLWLFRPRKSSR
jgi:glycerol-3-phosphate acyltransferase PlsY